MAAPRSRDERQRRLDRLLDREEILGCVTRYARGVDRHDDELILSAYHVDATDDHGVFRGTPDELVAFIERQHAPLASHMHLLGNHSVEIDGDCAHAETYFVAFLRQSGGNIRTVGGRYLDRLARRHREWRIEYRKIIYEWWARLEGLPGYSVPTEPGRWDRLDRSYQRPLGVSEPSTPEKRG